MYFYNNKLDLYNIIVFPPKGESMHPDGMLAMMKWEDTTPYMYFFKHGLDAEKVVSVLLIVFLDLYTLLHTF